MRNNSRCQIKDIYQLHFSIIFILFIANLLSKLWIMCQCVYNPLLSNIIRSNHEPFQAERSKNIPKTYGIRYTIVLSRWEPIRGRSQSPLIKISTYDTFYPQMYPTRALYLQILASTNIFGNNSLLAYRNNGSCWFLVHKEYHWEKDGWTQMGIRIRQIGNWEVQGLK